MKTEINPATTTRAYAYEMWMHAPMPMVTFFKTLDVTNLVKLSKREKLKLNMLICWCIGKAASGIKEFYMLPVRNKLIQYDTILFNHDYIRLTQQVAETCQNHDLTESMVIGTSALVNFEIDGAIGMYSGIFNNPFLIWGKFKKHLFRKHLTISFQFHHTQMDGAHAACFLEELQKVINHI